MSGARPLPEDVAEDVDPRGRRGWSLYQVPGISCWNGTLELEAHLRALERSGRSTFDIEHIAERFESAARTIADFTAWHGDGAWWVTGLPEADPPAVFLLFMVQQRRDQLTFVASELPLPWLEECRCPARRLPRKRSPELERAVNAHLERVRAVVAEIVAERLRKN